MIDQVLSQVTFEVPHFKALNYAPALCCDISKPFERFGKTYVWFHAVEVEQDILSELKRDPLVMNFQVLS